MIVPYRMLPYISDLLASVLGGEEHISGELRGGIETL